MCGIFRNCSPHPKVDSQVRGRVKQNRMPHPSGGSGSRFSTSHSFDETRRFVGDGVRFLSTTGERITASQGFSKNGDPTIVFKGERRVHGNVCQACWGFRLSCSGTRIGHCSEALDDTVS